MKPNTAILEEITGIPDWFRPHFKSLNRALTDISEVLNNGIVLAENMSYFARTLAVTDATPIEIAHTLGRNPVVQVTQGRILFYKVPRRSSTSITLWAKLPSATLKEQKYGRHDKLVSDDAALFFEGDIIRVGRVATRVREVRNDIIRTEDLVITTGITQVTLYQEPIDLLLF